MTHGIVPPLATARTTTWTRSLDDGADRRRATDADARDAPARRRCARRRPGGPPQLPKRERRSAITDEDRAFLDRAFQSIADRKAELLAESPKLQAHRRRGAS